MDKIVFFPSQQVCENSFKVIFLFLLFHRENHMTGEEEVAEGIDRILVLIFPCRGLAQMLLELRK